MDTSEDQGEGISLERPYTVSELTARIKEVLEETIPMCWVIGEVSAFTHHDSGHRYFTIKDEASQLSGVMFKWQARHLSFAPEPGMKIMVYGHVSVYERGGRYQLYAARIQPAGVGELSLAFEQPKNRLEAEGLFDQERKRPLPPYPQTIGVVTSSSGAAIRDIVQVIQRRAPGIQIVLRPARVQGEGAAQEIARAIHDLNRYPGIDILIVGRGGGSPEDLWPFNEEIVARAIYRSAVPVISAVGHEIDYTIADYVADHRAPTPSAAAEIVVQEHDALLRRVVELRRRLRNGMEMLLAYYEQRLEDKNPRRLLQRLQSRIEQAGQYADERREKLDEAMGRYLERRGDLLGRALTRLEDLSPLTSLARGFSLCERLEDGRLIRRGGELKLGERIRLRFQRGSAICRVEEISDE